MLFSLWWINLTYFFLTFNRQYQYSILLYIINNNIKHWEDVNYIPNITTLSVQDFLNLSFLKAWVFGFTIAEGYFGIKSEGSAFFNIKQKGAR